MPLPLPFAATTTTTPAGPVAAVPEQLAKPPSPQPDVPIEAFEQPAPPQDHDGGTGSGSDPEDLSGSLGKSAGVKVLRLGAAASEIAHFRKEISAIRQEWIRHRASNAQQQQAATLAMTNEVRTLREEVQKLRQAKQSTDKAAMLLQREVKQLRDRCDKLEATLGEAMMQRRMQPPPPPAVAAAGSVSDLPLPVGDLPPVKAPLNRTKRYGGTGLPPAPRNPVL
jgi:hypothetical protein